MNLRTDKELAEKIEKVTCKECGGRTDIPHDAEGLKACTCKTYAAGCEPPKF